MTISQLLDQCKELTINEKRAQTANFVEWVIHMKDLDRWEKIFNEAFGEPAKRAGERTTKEHFSLTVNYGGLWDDQILYQGV